LRWQPASITAAEIEQILEIEQLSFSQPWPSESLYGELTVADAFNLALHGENNHRKHLLIAYIFCRLVLGEMHIMRLAVSPSWRGRGAAGVLLQHSLEMASSRGAQKSLLEVRPSNGPALELYRKYGFRLIGRRPRYYPETGEDALVLMKDMKEAL